MQKHENAVQIAMRDGAQPALREGQDRFHVRVFTSMSWQKMMPLTPTFPLTGCSEISEIM